MLDSLDNFRAHCGEPTMPREHCSICAAIPESCYRETVSSLVADYDVEYGDESRGHDNVPPQVEQLVTFIDAPRRGKVAEAILRSAVVRCPACHRLYLHRNELTFVGARNYGTVSYNRVDDVDRFFRAEWCVSQRLSVRDVETVQAYDFFRHHAIVRFREARTWFSLDDNNHLVELTSEELPRLIARDPPAGLDDTARARHYAEFASEVADPEVRIIDSISAIRWRESLTDEDRDQIDAARAASRIEAPTAERVEDHAVVRLWVVSKARLICRIVTVRTTGELLREDAVIAENLPVA